MPVVSFYQFSAANNPAERKICQPGLSYRGDLLGEDFFEEIQCVVAAKLFVGHVLMEIGLAQVREVVSV